MATISNIIKVLQISVLIQPHESWVAATNSCIYLPINRKDLADAADISDSDISYFLRHTKFSVEQDCYYIED